MKPSLTHEGKYDHDTQLAEGTDRRIAITIIYRQLAQPLRIPVSESLRRYAVFAHPQCPATAATGEQCV